MPSDLDFRFLLLELDDEMSDGERKRFVFLLGSDIPKRCRTEPLSEIFTILMDRGRISETDCTYLEKILETLKMTKLAYKIARYSAGKTKLRIFLLAIVLLFSFPKVAVGPYRFNQPCLLLHQSRISLILTFPTTPSLPDSV